MKYDVEKISKRINSIIFIVTMIISIVIVVVVSTVLYEVHSDKENLLCYSIKCLNNFISYFEIITKLFAIFVAIVTVMLGWLTVQIYLSTYLTTHNNNKNSQLINTYSTYFEHLKYFNNIVDNYLDQNEIIKSKNIDKFKFYEFIFISPRNGNFEISDQYKSVIAKINQEIDKLNSSLPRKLAYVGHRDIVIDLVYSMGIKLPVCDRKDFLKLENEVFKFISNMNKNNGISPLKNCEYNPY